MSHELFRVSEATPAQLDLAMGGIVGGGLVLVVLFYLLLNWSQRKEARRGKERRPRSTPARRVRRRSS
jgi:hypothetical protein